MKCLGSLLCNSIKAPSPVAHLKEMLGLTRVALEHCDKIATKRNAAMESAAGEKRPLKRNMTYVMN